MNYARKILALLLVFCVALNLTSAVFAEGSDEELPPDETVVAEEPAPEETEPPDGEAPDDVKPPDETAPEETEAVPEETTEQPTEETGEAPPEEAAEEETTCFPLRIKNTRKALANLLSPWYSVCSEVLPTNGCPRNLIRLLRQAVEGFWTG